MATSHEALQAQRSVLRILAPDLCKIVDDMLDEVCNAGTVIDGVDVCPCGEKVWDEDWEEKSPALREHLIDLAAKHECAWTRMLRIWTSST